MLYCIQLKMFEKKPFVLSLVSCRIFGLMFNPFHNFSLIFSESLYLLSSPMVVLYVIWPRHGHSVAFVCEQCIFSVYIAVRLCVYVSLSVSMSWPYNYVDILCEQCTSSIYQSRCMCMYFYQYPCPDHICVHTVPNV